MKTKTWILLFAALALALAVVCVFLFFFHTPVKQAQVVSDGVTVMTLDLTKNGEYRIESDEGWNVLTVTDGCVSVTAASCAGQDCTRHAPANAGAPIVCLPNRLIIRFEETDYDTVLQ